MLQNIKTEWVAARKARNEVRAKLLGTVVSDINLRAKDDGNREPTDKDATKVVEKFLKQNQLALDARSTEQLLLEREILLSFVALQPATANVDYDAVIKQLIAEHPDKWAAAATNTKLVGFFLGQVMKATHGKADPVIVHQKFAEFALNE